MKQRAGAWRDGSWRRGAAALLAIGLLAASTGTSPRAAAQPGGGDCALAPFRERLDATLVSITVDHEAPVGRAMNLRGQPYDVIDVGITGTVDGCVVKSGPIPTLAQGAYSWLYDAPDISLPEEHVTIAPNDVHPLPYTAASGNTSPRYYARGTFKASDGAGLTFFLPAARDAWNGKLYVVERGSGIYEPLPPLIARAASDPFADVGATLFVPAMLDRGYAIAYFRKDSVRPPLGVSEVVLNDGSGMRTTYDAHVALPLAMTEFAQAYVEQALGARPRLTYQYGHSSGAITGRLSNYALGANVAHDGSPIVDGFLQDDAGGGLYLPVAFRDGREIAVLDDPAARAAFVPQIDVSRGLYNAASYLPRKRLNADLLRQKGLGDKHRHYEIRGVSHFDAGQVRSIDEGQAVRQPPTDNLDLGALMNALIDALDAWVDRGVAPAPSKSDAPGYEPAIALPEVACPLGVYYAGPPQFPGPPGTQRTAFAAYDGVSPEPVDSVLRQLVDMNGNGVADTRETVEAAWRRLGLLRPGQTFDAPGYAACLTDAAQGLVEQGLLPPAMTAWYARQAAMLLDRSGAAPSGAAPGQAAPAAKGTLRLAVAGLDTTTYAPIYIADKAGYFRELGLELDVKEANPPTATQALIAGQFDLAHAASPGIAAALKGAPLKMIFVVAEPSPYWIIAKKNLRAWTDLKGKTIGVSSTTGTQLLDTSRVLAMHGVNAQADGVNYVVPGGPGDEHKVAALRVGSIDAGVFAGTGTVVALDEGFSLLGDMHAINTYDYTLWANNQTMANKAELVRAFVTGTLKGQRVFKHDNAKAVEYLTQQLGGNRHWAEKLLELSASWFTDDGLPTDAKLREAIRYKEEGSGEPSTAGLEQWVAVDFARQANDELTRTGWKP